MVHLRQNAFLLLFVLVFSPIQSETAQGSAPAQGTGGFSVGERIMAARAGAIVRNASLNNVLFTQIGGVHGTIVGGPISGTAGNFTGNWWEIDWDAEPPNQNGKPGWSAESVLEPAPLGGDVRQPNFSSGLYSPVEGKNSLSPNIFVQSGEAPTSTPKAKDFSSEARGNCTWYAFGRMLELGVDESALKALNGPAAQWAHEANDAPATTGLKVVSEPEVHAIAQRDADSNFRQGHVAIVESINPDRTITVTESSYKADPTSPWNVLWRHRTVSPSWFSNFIHAPLVVCSASGVAADCSERKASPPTFNPPGGSYSSPLAVAISEATTDAVIHYTTNGSQPTLTSAVYSKPIEISSTKTLEAIAVAKGYTESTVARATYSIKLSGGLISPATVSVPEGGVQTFQSAFSSEGNATWEVEEGPSGGSVSANGVYTAPDTLGTFHVVATSSKKKEKAVATVHVVEPIPFVTLYSFSGGFVAAPLILGEDEEFYGTNEMMAYKINSSGRFQELAELSASPDAPISPLVQIAGGDFFGTMAEVGSNTTGRIFRMNSSGQYTILDSFSFPSSQYAGGAWPWAGLIEGKDGNFYGTTYAGGNISCDPFGFGVPAYGPFDYDPSSGYGCGTIFRMNKSGNIETLYSFSGKSDGSFPQASLIQGKDGDFYGTTSGGGANGSGTVFKVDASGNLKVLHSFSGADDSAPVAPVVQGLDGNLYGTAACITCAESHGLIYRISTTGGNFEVVHRFSGPDGALPVAPLIQTSDGSFYGTTWAGGQACGSYYFNVGSNFPYLDLAGCGTVFRMDPEGNITVLHAFQEPQTGDGNAPYAGVTLGKDGNLYGTTYYGGANIYFGTVFRVARQ